MEKMGVLVKKDLLEQAINLAWEKRVTPNLE